MSHPARQFRPADTGVFADLFLPDRVAPTPAVIVLGGSSGGIDFSDRIAAALARSGFAAFAVAYFGEPGLPASLANVPVEYFVRAAQLLAVQPEIDHSHIAVFGTSRGSEAAALLAGYAPDLINATVLQSPSSLVQVGYPDPHASAWTWQGRPLPAAPLSDLGEADPPDAQDALLPIARSNGPVITMCGDVDPVWPSCDYAAVIARLAGPTRATDLRYPLAGHSFISVSELVDAGLPVPDEYGGAVPEDVAAGHDAFAKVVAKLRAW